jgi:hypothetical protein
MPWRRVPGSIIAYIGAVIGTAGLYTQVFILVPWHDKLDARMDELALEVRQANRLALEAPSRTTASSNIMNAIGIQGVKQEHPADNRSAAAALTEVSR